MRNTLRVSGVELSHMWPSTTTLGCACAAEPISPTARIAAAKTVKTLCTEYLLRRIRTLESTSGGSLDHAVDQQQDHRADDRADPTDRVADLVQAERLPAEPADERATDAEQDRRDPAHRLRAGHDEARDRADDETDHQREQNLHQHENLPLMT